MKFLVFHLNCCLNNCSFIVINEKSLLKNICVQTNIKAFSQQYCLEACFQKPRNDASSSSIRNHDINLYFRLLISCSLNDTSFTCKTKVESEVMGSRVKKGCREWDLGFKSQDPLGVCNLPIKKKHNSIIPVKIWNLYELVVKKISKNPGFFFPLKRIFQWSDYSHCLLLFGL